MDITEDELQGLYTWVDEIPLSRPKRNIARDFSDGVLVAEVLYHFFPKEVQLHNYSAANSYAQKMYNWNTLNSKVCSRLNFVIPKAAADAAVRAQPLAIERVLQLLRVKIAELAEDDEQGQQQVRESNAATYANGPHQCDAATASEPHPVADNARADPRGSPHGAAAEASALAAEPRARGGTAGALRSGAGASAAQNSGGGGASAHAAEDQSELREMVEILETKARKLEQLVRIKDDKIKALAARLEAAGLS